MEVEIKKKFMFAAIGLIQGKGLFDSSELPILCFLKSNKFLEDETQY